MKKGYEQYLVEMKPLYALIVVLVMWLRGAFKIHHNVHITWIDFIMCDLYFSKAENKEIVSVIELSEYECI